MNHFPPKEQGDGSKGTASSVRNPYILNYCRVLVEKKGEKFDPEPMKKHLEKMYQLYEYMLGKNMINSLPEALKQQYLTLTQDLTNLTYEAIADIFDKNVPDYERIMKETMKEFANIYFRNRVLDPKDYPVPKEIFQDGQDED
ncbi:MAG: hypothetical protein GX443_09355 [Deltaproteobacteria bacterium]|nr:hypothetical protein [Deltaproteobacteria bacterium]